MRGPDPCDSRPLGPRGKTPVGILRGPCVHRLVHKCGAELWSRWLSETSKPTFGRGRLAGMKIKPLVSEKFRELVVYVAEKSADDPRFGAVKLNKILYYSDFIAYRRLGHSITDDEYQNLEEGPAPRHMLNAQRDLEQAGAVKVETREYFNNQQKRMVALRGPKPGVLDATELAIVDEVITELRPLNAREASDRSHREFGWRTTNVGEAIPYRTAWISSEPLSQEQIQVGVELAERRGLYTSTS
jgi:uncharacterized phage-associated protein